MAAKKKKKTATKARKKAPVKRAAKKASKKAPARKAKKAKPAKKTKATKKTKTTKKAKRSTGMLARVVKAVTKAVTPAKTKTKKKKQIVGEGDYQASRTFLKDQASFVEKNRDRIPALGQDAEKALDGPEGDDLRAAEAAGRSHSVAGREE